LLLRRRECHEQDGEMLSAGLPRTDLASSDPAMAFDLPLIGRAIIRPVFAISAASLLPDEWRTNPVSARDARTRRSLKCSTANPQPLDQRFVTRLIDTREIIEQLPPLRYELEQSTTGVIVLDVGLEVLGEAVDPLREEGYLHLRRTGIAGLDRIAFDHFGLAA